MSIGEEGLGATEAAAEEEDDAEEGMFDMDEEVDATEAAASGSAVENAQDPEESGPAFPSDLNHPVCVIDQIISVTMEFIEHYELVR